MSVGSSDTRREGRNKHSTSDVVLYFKHFNVRDRFGSGNNFIGVIDTAVTVPVSTLLDVLNKRVFLSLFPSFLVYKGKIHCFPNSYFPSFLLNFLSEPEERVMDSYNDSRDFRNVGT